MKFTPLVVLTTFLLASPASAIDIDADPYAPRVIIRERQESRPQQTRLPSYRGGGEAVARPRRPVALCRSGDTINSCGEPESAPEAPAGGGLVVTAGMAAEAVSEVPMPSLELQVQPDGPTLVNVATIFFAEPEIVETSIELLGVTIDIEATPVRFTWVYGDGRKQSTTTPGRPFPNKDVTHRYMQPATVAARVDTTYAVRFAIDGGDWIDLDEELTATGASTPVEVREALPVLVH